MRFSLLPTVIVDAITDLTPKLLQEKGVSLLMLDFDNTIVPYTTSVPTTKMADWIKGMLASDIQLCVVSNSKNNRVREFCKLYGLDCITRARKPFTGGILRCLEKYKLAPEKAALVGDQIYTDTLGAKSAGVTAILVNAIDNHNIWLKLRHVAELPFIYAGRNRRLTK